MKMKKITLAVAAVVAASTLLACTDNDKKVVFNDYWQKDWSVSETVNETLTYKVTFEKGSGLGAINYTLSYGQGSYQTVLKSTAQGYTYTTALSIPVSYEYGSEKEEYTDSVTTEVQFHRSGDGLKPISSKKTVDSHSPNNGDATALADCFAHFKYSVATLYNADGSAQSTVTYEETATVKPADPIVSDFQYGNGKYSYLDNEQILLALRAVSIEKADATYASSVQVYNPFEKEMQKVKLSFGASQGAEFSHTVNDNTLPVSNLNYREVTLVLDSKNPGATQTAWIATTAEKTTQNTNRNVMLLLKTPLSYNLGTLVYTLTSAKN